MRNDTWQYQTREQEEMRFREGRYWGLSESTISYSIRIYTHTPSICSLSLESFSASFLFIFFAVSFVWLPFLPSCPSVCVPYMTLFVNTPP